MANQIYSGYGMPEVDFSLLGKLGDIWQQNKVLGGTERSLASLGQGASYDDVARALAGVGNMEGFRAAATLGLTKAQQEATNAYHLGTLKVAQEREQREAGLPHTIKEQEPYSLESRNYIWDPKNRTYSRAIPDQTGQQAPVQQATEGIISAVPQSGPNAGQNIAPQINGAGTPAAAQPPPRPRNDALFNSLPPDMQGKVREVENNPEALHNYQGKDQQILERVVRNINPGWERPLPGWTPEATAINVRRMYNGDYSPLVNAGRGAQAGRTLERAWNGLAEYMIKEKGFTPDEAAQILSLKKQEFAAQGVGLTAGARTEGTREKNLEIILKVADAAIPAALEAAREVSRTGWVPINKMISASGTIITSNPAERKFGMANLQLAEHWARAMNPNGVMRESDRDIALQYLNNRGDSYGTYEQAVRQLKTQIDREYEGVRRHEPSRSDTMIGEIQRAASGGGKPPPGTVPPPAGGAPPPPPPGFQLVR